MVVICVQGPTEAERKIEELTRQLEEEMEKQEEEGEYFGKLLSLNFNSRKVIFGGPICSPHAIGECFCDILSHNCGRVFSNIYPRCIYGFQRNLVVMFCSRLCWCLNIVHLLPIMF